MLAFNEIYVMAPHPHLLLYQGMKRNEVLLRHTNLEQLEKKRMVTKNFKNSDTGDEG